MSTSGSATSGVDYTALPGSVTFQPGQSYVDVTVQPLADAVDEPVETVILSIANAGTTYLAAPGQQQAQATIDDPPRIQLDAPQPIDEGRILQLTGRVWNPDGTAITLEIDWDDSHTTTQQITPAAGGTSFSVQHVYADDGKSHARSDTYGITATVTDGANNQATAQANAVVNNVAPVWNDQWLFGLYGPLHILPLKLTAGSGVATLQGHVSDPGDDFFTLTIDWDDGGGPQDVGVPLIGRTFTVSHTYVEKEEKDLYTIKATITDDDSGSTGQATLVLDNNRAPVIDMDLDTIDVQDFFVTTIGPDRTVVGNPRQRDVHKVGATDPDSPDTKTFSITARTDDPNNPLFTIDPASGMVRLARDITPADVEAANGVYTLEITVTDAGGLTDSGTLEIRLVGVSVGITGDTQAIEDTVDQIAVRFERVVVAPAQLAAPLVVYFRINFNQRFTVADVYGDPVQDLHLGPAIPGQMYRNGTITIPANETFVTYNLTAVVDGLLEALETAQLQVLTPPQNEYTVVRRDVDAIDLPGTFAGLDLFKNLHLQILDDVTLWGRFYGTDQSDNADVDFNDVKQGNVGDCWFWAAVLALIDSDPGALQGILSDDGFSPAGLRSFLGRFYAPDGNGGYAQQTVDLDFELTRGFDSAKLSGDYDADRKVEVWTVVLEQAYAQFRGEYNLIDVGQSVLIAWRHLTGNDGLDFVTSTKTDEEIAEDIETAWAANAKVAVATRAGTSAPNIAGNHAYLVVDVRLDANGDVVEVSLMNPWGTDPHVVTLRREDFSEALSHVYQLNL